MSLDEYEGHWITTYSGVSFHYLDPKPEEIFIEDIARALSMICRFNGHCKEFYSVAEHCILVSELVKNNPLAGLLHDAHEAYLGDMTRPVKNELPDYLKLVGNVQRAIENKFMVGFYNTDEIKFADDTLLSTEKRDLLNAPVDAWAALPEPLLTRIHPLSPGAAEVRFTRVFEELRRANAH
jgi:uncharacterized protein